MMKLSVAQEEALIEAEAASTKLERTDQDLLTRKTRDQDQEATDHSLEIEATRSKKDLDPMEEVHVMALEGPVTDQVDHSIDQDQETSLKTEKDLSPLTKLKRNQRRDLILDLILEIEDPQEIEQ